MKTEINSPVASKINWTALVMALVGLAVAFDVVPADAREPMTEIALILGPVAVMTFRTWFTAPKK